MFDSYVAFHARMNPRAPAVHAPARTLTFAELNADVDRFAAALPEAGVRQGQVVAIAVGSGALQLVLVAALARLGIVSAVADDWGADLRLTDRAVEDAAGPAMHLTPEWIAAALARPAVASPQSPRDAEALGRVLATSGTTGPPRRAPYSWGQIDRMLKTQVMSVMTGIHGPIVPLTGFDSVLGFSLTLAAWACGAAVVVDATANALPERIQAFPGGLIGLTPAHLGALLSVLPHGYGPMSRWRLLLAGGATPPPVLQAARLRLTHDIVSVYGATETGGSARADSLVLERFPSAAGYVAPDSTVEVVDAEDVPVGCGVQGRVRVRTERMVSGYLDDAAATAASFKDGFFYPGDLGRLTAEGLLIIDGRADERMNLGGHKVLPNLVEQAAWDCPGVLDAAAFPMPDESGLQQCWLAVVRADGFQRAALEERLERLSEPMRPARLVWIDAIPRNAMGKIDRPRLRSACEGHAAS